MVRLASTSVLITGGAGFIGSALARTLVNFGYDVAVMDVLHPQVHGDHAAINFPSSVQLFTGDVTHAADLDAVLRLFRPSQIVHLAAETGTAQSLSEATRHGSVNVVGTTQLLDGLSRAAHVPDQIVLASSRAVYGEGAWQYGSQIFYPPPRSHAQLLAGNWDPQGPTDDPGVPLPELCQPDGAPTHQYLRRDQACPRTHLGCLDSRARHQSQRVAPAECLRAGPVTDQFLYRNSRPVRTIGS